MPPASIVQAKPRAPRPHAPPYPACHHAPRHRALPPTRALAGRPPLLTWPTFRTAASPEAQTALVGVKYGEPVPVVNGPAVPDEPARASGAAGHAVGVGAGAHDGGGVPVPVSVLAAAHERVGTSERVECDAGMRGGRKVANSDAGYLHASTSPRAAAARDSLSIVAVRAFTWESSRAREFWDSAGVGCGDLEGCRRSRVPRYSTRRPRSGVSSADAPQNHGKPGSQPCVSGGGGGRRVES